MRVLVCIPCLLTGGTEIQTLSMVEALVAAGHEVTTVCYFEHNAAMTARYEQAGCRVVCLSPDGTRPKGVWPTVRFLFRGLRRVVRDVRPDVAHVQYMAPGAIPVVLLRLLGIKTIVATAHTAADIYTPGGLKLLRWLTRHMLRAFTCITERAERSFFGQSQLYSPDVPLKAKGHHFTIYNCLPAHLPVATAPRTFGPRLTIGVVSRLVPVKGMDLVLPAFCTIHAQHPDTRLLVVGDGELRQDMEQQASELRLTDKVRFLGQQPQAALASIYDEIDILLMPSRSEGFGLTALEGMARGCVVVAADVGGLPEVVIDGRTGLLHRVGDADDMARQTGRLMADPLLLPAMSSASLARAALFSASRYQALIGDMYEKL